MTPLRTLLLPARLHPAPGGWGGVMGVCPSPATPNSWLQEMGLSRRSFDGPSKELGLPSPVAMGDAHVRDPCAGATAFPSAPLQGFACARTALQAATGRGTSLPVQAAPDVL